MEGMQPKTAVVLVGVHEYMEGLPVELCTYHNGRRTLRAKVKGGYLEVEIDLDDVLYKLGLK